MSKAKFAPAVYAALRDKGFSNRQIATLLDVNEASVRRALKGVSPVTKRRVTIFVIEE